MRIELDVDKCIAAGQCVLVAPEVFDQDDDGIVILIDEDPGPEQLAVVEQAVDLCPARLIQLSEAQ